MFLQSYLSALTVIIMCSGEVRKKNVISIFCKFQVQTAASTRAVSANATQTVHPANTPIRTAANEIEFGIRNQKLSSEYRPPKRADWLAKPTDTKEAVYEGG